MTRTAVRHALSALAALALVFAFACGPAAAQHNVQELENFKINTPKGGSSKTPKGLATRSAGGGINPGSYYILGGVDDNIDMGGGQDMTNAMVPSTKKQGTQNSKARSNLPAGIPAPVGNLVSVSGPD